MVRFYYFVAITLGGTVGWWLGDYGGLTTALIASTLGSLIGVYGVYRLTRDYV
jgi:membrane protein YqaA with SNARE-associated domain